MYTLLHETLTFRVDTEEEAKSLIETVKEEGPEAGFVLKGYSSKLKEKKSKGEVIDQGFEVTLKKEYNTFWEA